VWSPAAPASMKSYPFNTKRTTALGISGIVALALIVAR
jgi:hypothetical protein